MTRQFQIKKLFCALIRSTSVKYLLFVLGLAGPMIMCTPSFGQELQTNDSLVFLSGRAFDEYGRPVGDLMVVNKRKGTGIFGESDGSYLIRIRKGDVVQFGSLGYISEQVCFADSAYRPQYTFDIKLRRLRFEIAEAQVIAPRELREILEDIEALGYEEKDYRLSNIDALSSPITFLYEMFSQQEQSKRQVIEMVNDDLRRELLKELFAKYVEYDIIDLSDSEFDSFITYMDPGDEVLQSLTQYQFIMYVKEKFKDFRSKGRRMNGLDDQYHLDD
jgi:hypothetical protein